MYSGLKAILLTAKLAFAAPSLSAVERHILLDDCVVSGCSNQLCIEAATAPAPIPLICQAYPSYSTFGECKRQPSGQCGWTPTAALAACMLRTSAQPDIAAPLQKETR